MLKWAVTPRLSGDFDEQDGIQKSDSLEILTLQALIERHELPCLVRLINDDINQSNDNYCLLLGETNDPYLIVSNEVERFSIPVSFDGLFASVEHGVTRYNIFQTVQALQSCLKSPSSPPSSSTLPYFTHFTILQTHMAFSNGSIHRMAPGTLLEPSYRPIKSASSPSPSTTSSSRLRTLLANFPRSLNKHLLPNYQQTRAVKNQQLANDYFEVKSNAHEDNLSVKFDSNGFFVPVHTIPPSSMLSYLSYVSNGIQGLYTTNLLSKLTDQYPLIVELIVSRALEENIPATGGYPLRRITLHRLVENHPRIIAFDMKNYAFIEIDSINSADMYTIEHDNTMFLRYQAQVRWCHRHLTAFRSQAKTLVHSSNGTAMFLQATPFHGQRLQQYHQRRNSSSTACSPLVKHMPQTIFTSQESISSSRLRFHAPTSSKFHTTSNHTKHQDQQRQKGKTFGASGVARKDVRVYFNDPTIKKHLQNERELFSGQHTNKGQNSVGSDSVNGDEENDNSFQCTSL